MQGADKCNAATDSASKEPIRVGNETDTDVGSNTQTYQRQTERSEVKWQQSKLEITYDVLFPTDYDNSQS